MSTTDYGLSHYVGRRRARLSTPAQLELKEARDEAYRMIREAHETVADIKKEAHETAAGIKKEAQEQIREAREDLRAIRIRVGRQRNVLSKVQDQIAKAKEELEALNREKLSSLNDRERNEGLERLRLITSEVYRPAHGLAS
ncbi:hypothetical protein [Glutamicibacter sp. FBE19]|uniref:hypothetical protein n=1 Tax=Glutamicibacter sp. FBE19 TaxID=2761534 RepID=UPI00189696E0|nr:hypothetical protein [Glutamicibacter sp. FBE19]MBF6671545.1 hypothetical protein [Glutamicibacter sp. FBE19]